MSQIYSWRGCNNIFARFNGSWDDSDILYDVYCFHCWDIENALWESFTESININIGTPITDQIDEAFSQYIREEAESYLIECIHNNYFAPGRRSWNIYDQSSDNTSHATL